MDCASMIRAAGRISLPPLRCLLLGLFLGAGGSTSRPAAGWSPCHWNRENCWSSSSGTWKAIVASDRARLVYFGPNDERHNLLYPPGDPELAPAPDWGGHRFWLGPQWKWNPIWPPPADWESSAASQIEIEGERLTVKLAHRITTLPQVSRTYAWREGALHIEGLWSGDSYQGIHIFQVPTTAEIEADGGRSPALPSGFGLLQAGSSEPPVTKISISPAVLEPAGTSHFMIRYRGVESKLGFMPGTLTICEGNYGFRLKRGRVVGRVSGRPDGGLLTQIYTGDRTNPYLEAEQLSAILASSAQPNEFEVILEPLPRPKP